MIDNMVTSNNTLFFVRKSILHLEKEWYLLFLQFFLAVISINNIQYTYWDALNIK